MRRDSLLMVSAFLFLVSCSDPEQLPYPLSDVPLPPAAYDMGFKSSDGSQSNELSFKIDLKYPSKSVLEHYGAHFKAPTWTKCRGPADDWQKVIDGRTMPAQKVHSLAHYWLNKDEETFVAVELRYLSPEDAPYRYPVNNTQHVKVAFGMFSDAASSLRLARIYCGAGDV